MWNEKVLIPITSPNLSGERDYNMSKDYTEANARRKLTPHQKISSSYSFLMIKSIWNLLQSSGDEKICDLKKEIKPWKPLGRLPNWLSQLDKEKLYSHARIRSVNRYLAYQETRLKKLVSLKKFQAAVVLWCILLKNSKSYQVALFHNSVKGWYYKLSKKEAMNLLISSMNKCRRWDTRLDLKRFYLDKGMEKTGVPDGRLRPIGAPTYPSRIIAKSINNLIYLIYEDQFLSSQHGYRRNQGTHTALKEVFKLLFVEKNDYVYEFDFMSFFNKVDPKWVRLYLNSRCRDLSHLIIRVISQIRYKFDREIRKIPWESEIRLFGIRPVDGKPGKWKTHLVRNGLPQGLAFSPILATLVLELIEWPKGLVMCADDGLVITKKSKSNEVEEWLRKIKRFGINVERKKTGEVGNEFKFLGVIFNREAETATFRDSKICWKNWDLGERSNVDVMNNWFKNVAQFYGKEPEKWNWEIRKGSYCEEHYVELYDYFKVEAWENISRLWFNSTFWESFKGLRHFNRVGESKGGVLQISKTSSLSCESLLGDLKDKSLVRTKKLKFLPRFTGKKYYNKGKYLEEANRRSDNLLPRDNMDSAWITETFKINRQWL